MEAEMAEDIQNKKVTLEELVVSTLAMCHALSKLMIARSHY
jgi:hypothetical protein